jgi:hypothetical protein
MQQIFAFTKTALVVRHWFEIDLRDASMEHGCRIELRRLAPHEHRGSESASQLVTLDRPLWRADLFDRVGSAPGSYDVAHFHPSFDGVEPCPREWNENLTADPWQWLEGQLSSWRTDEASPVAAADAADLVEMARTIVAAGRSFAPERCRSVKDCYRMTADVRESVLLMIKQQERPEILDRAYVEPWVADGVPISSPPYID